MKKAYFFVSVSGFWIGLVFGLRLCANMAGL